MIDLNGKSPKVLVIGDLMVDHYLWGSCDRISPEAPVQVVNIENESKLLGGAGNVANNLKALGASVDIISVIGDCNISEELKDLLVNIEIDPKYIFTDPGRISSKKSRVIASQQQVVRFDKEISEDISNDLQQSILSTFKSIVSSYDSILLSDYGKGVLTENLTKSIIEIANNFRKKVLIDPKGSDYSKYKGAYLLTPNRKEASEATQIIINDDQSLKKAIKFLKTKYKLSLSLITLSDQGLAVYDKNLRIHPTFTREVFDVTGAGDTVLASLGFAIACDLNIDKAIEFANLAAGVVVGKIGSATTTINEIIEYESSFNQTFSENNLKTFEEIDLICSRLKSIGKSIVFTNGCFDLLHSGHIKYLETAKSFGDILIVGINSDASVKALKGKDRPINIQIDRAYLLAAIGVVDYVVIFDEETPYNLIEMIKPNVLVKGGDYEGKEIVGQEIVNELKIVKYLDGRSSSETIKKIRSQG